MATASAIVEDIEDKLVALSLPNTVSADDGLTPVYTLEDWLATEQDRRFVVLVTSGPQRAPSRSRCSDKITCEVRVRYFADRESRARMLDDVGTIRECLKGSSGVTDLVGTPAVTGPTYDYGQWAGLNAVGVKFGLEIEYHTGS